MVRIVCFLYVFNSMCVWVCLGSGPVRPKKSVSCGHLRGVCAVRAHLARALTGLPRSMYTVMKKSVSCGHPPSAGAARRSARAPLCAALCAVGAGGALPRAFARVCGCLGSGRRRHAADLCSPRNRCPADTFSLGGRSPTLPRAELQCGAGAAGEYIAQGWRGWCRGCGTAECCSVGWDGVDAHAGRAA